MGECRCKKCGRVSELGTFDFSSCVCGGTFEDVNRPSPLGNRYGCYNKRRFSIKYPDGRVERYGSCDPKDDDNRDIVNGKLLHLNVERVVLGSEVLPEGTLWTNGYYDKEHDGWKPLSEWV